MKNEFEIQNEFQTVIADLSPIYSNTFECSCKRTTNVTHMIFNAEHL